MDQLLQDVRYGFRMLRKAPGFTLVAVITLAVGIGANSAVFSVFSTYFLRSLPFSRPQQLVHIWGTVPNREYGDQAHVSQANFLDWRQRATSFDQLGAYYYQMSNVAAPERPLQIQVTRVTANLPSLLGVAPIIGRMFANGEDQPGRNKEVLLSYTYWQRHFSSDRNVLGQTVRLDGENYSIIGVMPEAFVFPLKATQMWTPMALVGDESRRGDNGPLLVVGRLRPGVTMQAAQAEMNHISRALASEYPAANKGAGARIVALQEALLFFYSELRLMFLGLLLATGCVLLIVCSNLGNLLVARAIDRSREVAIRSALGATRMRVIRQLITESTLLALLGAVAGILFAGWGVDVLDLKMPADLYRVGHISIDVQVLVFTLAVALLAVCFFGLAPALLVSRPKLTEVLKEGSRTGLSFKSRRIHNVLVAGQIALATVLLAGAILSVHTFLRQRSVSPGFDASNVLTMQVILPRTDYPDAASINRFYSDVLARVQRLPGVKSAATVNPLPMNFELYTEQYLPEGKPQSLAQNAEAVTFTVAPGYFRTMQIPVLQGSAFTEQNAAGAPAVVMVNRLLAQKAWPNEDVVGKSIRLFENNGRTRVATVVGVVGNSTDFLMNQELRPQIYVPHLQDPSLRCFLVVKTTGEPMSSVAAVRNEIQAVDKNVPVAEVRSMDDVLLDALSPFMFAAAILGVLGFGALLLAAIGIYGVISYAVRQRSHEIGVRIALGAREGEIVRLVLRQGARLAGIGLGIGLLGTLALMQVVRAALPGSKFDPLVLVGTPVLLAGVALLACFLPARRASHVDPMVALRYE